MSNTIRDVEIFAAGTHNGDVYTTRDLDDMVEAHKALDFRPAIKIGHTKDYPGAPAYGWVENLRRAGNKLLADFTDMHDSVVGALRKRMYGRVSAEVFFNLKRGDKLFRRALKAVALLGVEVPAVSGLKPLHKMEFADLDYFDTVRLCPLSLVIEESPGAVVHQAVERYMRAHPEVSYSAALKAAFDPTVPEHRAYADRWSKDWTAADSPPAGPRVGPGAPSAGLRSEGEPGAPFAPSGKTQRVPQPEYPGRGDAGAEIHRRVMELMRGAARQLDYTAALELVLADDPELAKVYRGVRAPAEAFGPIPESKER